MGEQWDPAELKSGCEKEDSRDRRTDTVCVCVYTRTRMAPILLLVINNSLELEGKKGHPCFITI